VFLPLCVWACVCVELVIINRGRWTHFTSVVCADNKTSIPSFPMDSLLPCDSTAIYTYSGSLTTPPCAQDVNWNVMAQPVYIHAAVVRDVMPYINYIYIYIYIYICIYSKPVKCDFDHCTNWIRQYGNDNKASIYLCVLLSMFCLSRCWLISLSTFSLFFFCAKLHCFLPLKVTRVISLIYWNSYAGSIQWVITWHSEHVLVRIHDIFVLNENSFLCSLLFISLQSSRPFFLLAAEINIVYSL